MLKDFKFIHLDQNLFLHPYKSIYWSEQRMLLLADVHYGKAAHFRKSGIAIPETVHRQDLDRLAFLIAHYQPERIMILGDLFHSAYNQSWQVFQQFFESQISFKPELVPGNHDILDKHHYQRYHLHEAPLAIGPYILSHVPIAPGLLGGTTNLCGHIHPAVSIRGKARQSLKLECFYFNKNHGILPAFGRFTGTAKMQQRHPGDTVFAVTDQKVVPIA
ncbi:MAG: ligase-associated DNA damage response endonuclease PdeM [Cyclobacteriaceae bacterium]|nr:ligase-associated DNA damage response endonuclease PdeM [Cyclobacteriaceae bacterium]